jgi:hypothetical protein
MSGVLVGVLALACPIGGLLLGVIVRLAQGKRVLP